MSIPPLVCSTPPPPEQCEDDKDPEDFDLQYNLSQEDSDENYDYGNFSTYNHFQSSTCTNEDTPATIKVVDNNKISSTPEPDTTETVLGTNNTNQNKSKLEEETNIEDLNLKVDEETIGKTDVKYNKDSSVEIDTNAPTLDCSDKDIPIDTDDFRQGGLNTHEDLPVPSTSLDIQSLETPAFTDEIIEDISNIVPVNTSENVSRDASPSEDSRPDTVKEVPEEHSDKINIVEDDDFGDFEDFQISSSDSKPTTVVDNCDNPWDTKELDNNDFGDFKANFDGTVNNLLSNLESTIEHSKEETQPENQTVKNESDDDFGEFDDFKSSAEVEVNVFSEESLSYQDVPVLNLQSLDNENQFIERVNKMINSIFEDEIPEPETEFEGKLESRLGETWGHLLETDVRQPYMVNWNNSVGQKTLLKSLCIDSRNILFGPKWSYNMPKYAANLGMAPLQPQKHSAAPSVTQSETLNPDKTGAKATGTWSDPFASNGQESCNTDSGSEPVVVDTGPTDLDVFEAAVSSKPDKIYSSTLNVQPLRQINLPDTHIFTPTDSETPRSNTIHYDSSPAVLLPQTVIETNKNQPDNLAAQPSCSSTVASNLADDSEHWEFQDFKGSNTPISANQQTTEKTENLTNAPNSTVTYGTQVLQPIKVVPIMPTLNWPDPGEVKETFEDFSDFISNSSWSNEQPNITSPTASVPQMNDPAANIKTEISTKDRVSTDNNDTFDDDFDTFQSALPSHNSLGKVEINHLSNETTKPAIISPQTSSQKIPEFTNTFPKIDTVKSDSISFPYATRPTNNLVQNSMSITSLPIDNTTNTNNKLQIRPQTIQFNNNLLQPTPASSSSTSHNQQKSTQILQPLSLESYSQINWPNPGIDLQDLSRFNPVETLQSLKSDLSVNSHSKVASPAHIPKSSASNQASDDDIWGEFVSSKPKQQQALPKKSPTFVDDDEWTDFVSSPSVKPQNGLNTISLNVHTNLNIKKSSNHNKNAMKSNQTIDIPTLNYITPKSNTQKTYNSKHFQNL